MRSTPGKYMTSSTTMGVTCEFGSRGRSWAASLAPAGGVSLRKEWVHALVRSATLSVVICVSAEYPVPARSPRYIGQSVGVGASASCGAHPDSDRASASRALTGVGVRPVERIGSSSCLDLGRFDPGDYDRTGMWGLVKATASWLDGAKPRIFVASHVPGG